LSASRKNVGDYLMVKKHPYKGFYGRIQKERNRIHQAKKIKKAIDLGIKLVNSGIVLYGLYSHFLKDKLAQQKKSKKDL